MEPASAIGVASSAIAFVEFSYKFLHSLYDAHYAGSAADYADLEEICNKMQPLAIEVLGTLRNPKMSQSEMAIKDLAEQCYMLSMMASTHIGKTKASGGKMGDAFKAALFAIGSRAEIKRLQANLENCRAQLHLHLAVCQR
jgi:hypothetical protein